VLYEILDADPAANREAKLRALPDFEAALNSYDAHDFPTAITYLEKALSVAPSDSIAKVLLERMRGFVAGRLDTMSEGVIRLKKADKF